MDLSQISALLAAEQQQLQSLKPNDPNSQADIEQLDTEIEEQSIELQNLQSNVQNQNNSLHFDPNMNPDLKNLVHNLETSS